MTMTPINRIPLAGMTEQGMIDSEGNRGSIEAGDALTALIDHTGDQDAISCTLDWAMQLRDRTGCDWGTAIDIAMVAYFG